MWRVKSTGKPFLLKLLFHVAGISSLIGTTLFGLSIVVQIALTGQAIIGVEHNTFILALEVALLGFAVCYSFFILQAVFEKYFPLGGKQKRTVNP